jgi:hypothetical protein
MALLGALSITLPSPRRADGVTFSRDPFSARGAHAYNSSIAQSKAIGVVATTKDTKAGAVPAVALITRDEKGLTKKTPLPASAKKAAAAIDALTLGQYYRPDARAAALQRYTALAKAARTRGVAGRKYQTGRASSIKL